MKKPYEIIKDEIIPMLLSKGYRVLYAEGRNYCHFSNGKAVAYVQYDNFDGLRYSVKHKGDKSNGSGFQTCLNEAFIQPTKRWSDTPIRYYKDFDEFICKYWDKTAKEVKGA